VPCAGSEELCSDAAVRGLTPSGAFTNNEITVRKALAIALSFVIHAAGVWTPFAHAHPDDHATEHHAGRTVHVHWSGHSQSHHPSNVPAIGDDDHDRAVFMGTFVALGAASVPMPVVMEAVFECPAPTERRGHRTVQTVRSHDPPCLASRSARAPPALLS
jgi:hypothetical protein